MNRKGIAIIGVLVALLAGAWGCDRSPAPAIQAPPPAGRTVVEITPITQLPLKQTAHVVVDALGNVFYSIETDGGQDTAIAVGESGIPRQTQLTSTKILAAMGESTGGSGAIQSLAADADGSLIFYFSGGKGQTVRVCIGRYTPRTDSIKILVDTPSLIAASGMGESIALAHGMLLPMGEKMFLFLRHSDAWGLFSFKLKASGLTETTTLSRVVDRIRLDDEDADLTRQRFELSPGPIGADHVSPTLLLMDRTSGELWQVDPATGAGTLRLLLVGLPQELSAPIVFNNDQLLFFAADSEPIASGNLDMTGRKVPQTSYPALLDVKDKEISAIGREDFRAPNGFPAYAIHIRELHLAPDGSFVGADINSGQLMRLRMMTVNAH